MDDKKYTKEQKGVLAVSMLTSFLTTFMGSALNLSIPIIGNEFGASAALVSWIVTIYMLTCAVLAIPVGMVADKMASKKIMCAGLLVFFVGSILILFSSNIYVFLGLRGVQAVGASMLFATNIAILAFTFKENTRGKAIGLATAANFSGLLAGPVLGGFINYYLGWRYIFGISAGISMVTMAFAVRYIGKGENVNSAPKDYKNDIKRIMVNKGFVCANVAAFVVYGVVFGTNYLMSIYLQSVKGYTSQWAGVILLAAPIMQTIFSLFGSKILDRLSSRIISSGAIIICGVSIFVLGFVDAKTSLSTLVIGMMIVGVGSALFSAPNTNMVMSSVDKGNYSLASSILATMRSFGHTASMWVITLFTKLNIGNMVLSKAPVESLIDTLNISLYFFAGLCIIGFFIALKGKS